MLQRSSFDNTLKIDDVSSVDDLGPQLTHVYTLSNMGDLAVGNVVVNISWPLKVTSIDEFCEVSAMMLTHSCRVPVVGQSLTSWKIPS